MPLEIIRRRLSASDWQTLEPLLSRQHNIYVWGAADGPQNVRKWRDMSQGDICLFYSRGSFVFAAKILCKIENEDLARDLWGVDSLGNTWKYIYFLTERKSINITLEEFNKVHNYNFRAVMGLTRVNPEAVRRIEREYGSYEAFLNTFTRSDQTTHRSSIGLIKPDLPSLKDVCSAFADALTQAGIYFGPRHLILVRSFIASLSTKGFVILTGLSGSGKTQIALRFGDWIGGRDYSLKVPVRPDWTGPEALFGYEDALLPTAPDGRRSWHVPRPLEFMLRAAADQQRPYLLILDEMNLAHVERYFADMLSGMESDYPCLPNLQQDSDGFWRTPLNGDKWITIPRNLLVIGTVNVDETTYMFSPKVLDRANTIEFRVSTDELTHDARKPTTCKPADVAMIRAFHAVATNPNWHVEHPAPHVNEFSEHLRVIHRILATSGFEFGHRVYTEAIRFACILYECGEEDVLTALDLQVIQKILPRLHGSRRRLEDVLISLARFCYDPVLFTNRSVPERSFQPEDMDPQKAKLSTSFSKIQRMLRILRSNQFVSFAE